MGWVQITNIKGKDGLPGTPGGSQYVHSQTTPAATWNVNHNLGYFPHITIIMDDGTMVVADIDQLDANSAIITFPTPYTGKAVCS
jgi:hypothetical protein